MKKKLKALRQVPAAAHVLRMNARYGTRLGNQFAGAITYFSSIYSSAGWAANLKSAVRAQTRPLFDMKESKHFMPLEILLNLAILLGLLAILAVTFALAGMATSMTGTIVRWLGLDGLPGVLVLLRIVGPILSAVAGWTMFVYLYKVLPEVKLPFPIIAWGALLGSLGLFGLQYLTGFLMGKFAGNPAAVAFGPVITLMLFFNLFARLNLYVAAWIATSVQPAVADQIQDFDRPLLKALGVSEPISS
jgi:membrane protein